MKRDMIRARRAVSRANGLTSPRVLYNHDVFLGHRESPLHSLAEVVDISKSNRRTIQFWVEAGALIPSADTNRQGRGVHRSFDRLELIIACILSAVLQFQTPIGRLIGIAAGFRAEYLANEDLREKLDAAISGKSNVILVIEPGQEFRILADPTSEETYQYLVGDMISYNKRSDTARGAFFLNPWLAGVSRR
jgi:hypothetical protein